MRSLMSASKFMMFERRWTFFALMEAEQETFEKGNDGSVLRLSTDYVRYGEHSFLVRFDKER